MIAQTTAPTIDAGYLRGWAFIVVGLVVLIVGRWLIGRRVRWLRRLELHTLERAMLAQSHIFPRRSRRWRRYDTSNSLVGTPLDPDAGEHWRRYEADDEADDQPRPRIDPGPGIPTHPERPT